MSAIGDVGGPGDGAPRVAGLLAEDHRLLEADEAGDRHDQQRAGAGAGQAARVERGGRGVEGGGEQVGEAEDGDEDDLGDQQGGEDLAVDRDVADAEDGDQRPGDQAR